MNTQRAVTMPAHTKMRLTEERQTSAKDTVLGLPGPPEPSYPSRLSYQQGVHRASRLPSMLLGLGLMPAKTTNSPLIKPDKSSLLTRASCLPARKLGLGLTLANQT